MERLEAERLLEECRARAAWAVFQESLLAAHRRHNELTLELGVTRGKPERALDGVYLTAMLPSAGSLSIAWGETLRQLTIEAMAQDPATTRRARLKENLGRLLLERGAL